MKLKFFNFDEKLNLEKLILIFGLIVSLSSITFNPQKLLVFNQLNFLISSFRFYYLDNDILYFIDLLRGFGTLVFFPILLYLFFKYHFTNKIDLKSNIFFFLFSTYLILQFVGFFTSDPLLPIDLNYLSSYENLVLSGKKNDLINCYYLFNSLVVLMTFHLSSKIFTENDFQIFFVIIIFFLLSIFLFFSYQYFNYFVTDPKMILYHVWGSIDPTNITVGAPRPTGLSRTALIILIAFHSYLFLKNDTKILNQFFLVCLATMIYLLGARSSILLLLIYVFMHFFFNKKTVNFFNYLIIFVIIPLVLHYSINFSKFEIHKYIKQNYSMNCAGSMLPEKKLNRLLKSEMLKCKKILKAQQRKCNELKIKTREEGISCDLVKKKISYMLVILKITKVIRSPSGEEYITFLEDDSDEFKIQKSFRVHRVGKYGSGRIGDWKEILLDNKKKFFGYGVQGDRVLINQSASNGLIYAYASGGIFALLVMIFFSLLVFYYSVAFFINSSGIKHSLLHVISAYIVIILLIRSIVESSYGIFGIDLILFTFCSLAIEKKIIKN